MKKLFVLGVWLVIACFAQPAQAASLLFQYTGTVKTVGGTVIDGSLLPFLPGDTVSGCFVFDSPGPPGRTPLGFYEGSISAFQFGTFVAEGTNRSSSYFHIDPSFSWVNAYKQVGTGPIYDNFSFGLTVPGVTWTDAKPVNLLVINELDPLQFNWAMGTNFVLERVDISSSNPLRFVEVRVSIDSISVRPGTSCGAGVIN